jgi:hypothetical protein
MLRFRLFSVLSLLVLVAVAAGCGGGGSSAPALTTITVQVAVNSPTPLGFLQFSLDNTGTAIYVPNSAKLMSPPESIPDPNNLPASQTGNKTNIAFFITPAASNPVIQAQFQVNGTPTFTIDSAGIVATDASLNDVTLTTNNFAAPVIL